MKSLAMTGYVHLQSLAIYQQFGKLISIKLETISAHVQKTVLGKFGV
jgi:hypothetical protein